jgi:hypothetical protein
MKFCTITPTRGDRPQFLEFCKHQLSRMKVKPDHSYFIDFPPASSFPDLTPRVKEGLRQAKLDGFEYAFIVEDDDYYSPDYFERMDINGHDFIGGLRTTYYNIKTKRYQHLHHDGRSSLFTTGFKISALDKFPWDKIKDTDVRLDIHLWEHARRSPRKYATSGAVGIKHGTGLCAGGGHFKEFKIADPDMAWLSQNVDSEALIFYKTVKV